MSGMKAILLCIESPNGNRLHWICSRHDSVKDADIKYAEVVSAAREKNRHRPRSTILLPFKPMLWVDYIAQIYCRWQLAPLSVRILDGDEKP